VSGSVERATTDTSSVVRQAAVQGPSSEVGVSIGPPSLDGTLGLAAPGEPLGSSESRSRAHGNMEGPDSAVPGARLMDGLSAPRRDGVADPHFQPGTGRPTRRPMTNGRQPPLDGALPRFAPVSTFRPRWCWYGVVDMTVRHGGREYTAILG
jgi:hypothetical protein